MRVVAQIVQIIHTHTRTRTPARTSPPPPPPSPIETLPADGAPPVATGAVAGLPNEKPRVAVVVATVLPNEKPLPGGGAPVVSDAVPAARAAVGLPPPNEKTLPVAPAASVAAGAEDPPLDGVSSVIER